MKEYIEEIDNEKLKSQIAQNSEILKFLQNRLEELDNNQNISKIPH